MKFLVIFLKDYDAVRTNGQWKYAIKLASWRYC